MEELQRIEQWLGPLLKHLQPAEQRVLARQLAQRVRKANQKTIAAQQAPDGTAWQPRKHRSRNRAGTLRQGPMFRKLRTAKHLKAQGFTNEAVVQFMSRATRIARVHHDGLRDQVAPGGAQYDYPARPLIGVPDALADQLVDHILQQLST
ncbi:phage virion morphogenesis protein [Comamonas nitrativorans]|uniref:Phage virion morphogenesis protein n=1 Tax=Comamonas nitrativorans TaxID=108437 RepID=A0ABV9H0P6_9BURK